MSKNKENIQTIIDKIYENIEEAFDNIKLETLMAASNMFGRGLGSKKIALILSLV